MAGGQSKIWALRMPGGPTKIVKSNMMMTEDFAKEAYIESVNHRSAEWKNDPDVAWPLVEILDEVSAQSDKYNWCGQISGVTGRPRALVEV